MTQEELPIYPEHQWIFDLIDKYNREEQEVDK